MDRNRATVTLVGALLLTERRDLGYWGRMQAFETALRIIGYQVVKRLGGTWLPHKSPLTAFFAGVALNRGMY